MKVTRLGPPFPLMTFGLGSSDEVPPPGTSGQVLTATGSNSDYWGENIARITANGSNSNTLVGPFVNIAAGTGVSLATSSNTLTIGATGGGSAQLASITAASAAIAATETVVVSASLAAGYLTAGMSFRIHAAGIGTTGATPGSDTFRIRIGPTTLTGTISTSVTALGIAVVTAQPFDFDAVITLRTSGAGGTIIGECAVQADSVVTGRYAVLNSLSATVASVAVDTTVANLLQLTYISGNAGSSNTFHVAEIEVLSSGAAGGGSGALVLLEQHTASASATLDFTTFISSTYDTYLIEGVELVLATNGADLLIRIGTGGGPTYDTGNNYEFALSGRTTGGSAATDAGVPVSAGKVFNAIVNTAGYGFGSFSLTATGLMSTALRKTLQGTLQYVNTPAGPVSIFGMWGMQWTTSGTAATALRFVASSGNITSGTIRIYGVAK